MVQNYADVIAKQKDIGSAKILNPNYDVQVNQQNFANEQERIRVDKLNAQNKLDSIQKYKDDLIAQGFSDQGNGVFYKRKKYSDGSSKTTTITIDSDGNVSQKVKRTEVRKVKSEPTQSVSVSVLPIATSISSGGLASMQKQEPMARLIGEPESANRPISQIPELNKGSTTVAPVQTKTSSSTSVSSFTVPRTVSSSETQSVPLSVDVSKVLPVQTQPVQSFGGSIQARRVGDFAIRYDQQGNRLTPTPTDLAEMKVVNALSGSELSPIAQGVASGLLAPARLGETLHSASNFNPYSENQKAVQSQIKQSVVEVVKDPFTKLVAEPVQTVVNNPLYEAPKLVTEIFLFEGASRGIKTIVKEVGETNKFLKSDVQSSAYDLSRSSEQAQIFLKDNQINPSASGGNEFVPLPQLTVDVSKFNKNQRYFSDPQLDVGVDRQFTLAGTEVKPSLNKKGILPLDEVQVSPFESNKLTIEQIGKKPLIDATSTAQSRVVDLPVAKSFNKDTLQGTPVVDLMNPDRSSFISQDLKQSTLAPIENKVSSVPKGSQKPLIYEKVKPVENKPVIDNSFAFESGGSVVVAESGSAPVSLPARSFGSERVLKVNAEYVFDSSSGEYVRKVGDLELNLDIKGKVTPQNFGSLGSVSVGSVSVLSNPQVQEPSVISKIKIDSVQSPSIKSDLGSGLKSDPFVTAKTKIIQSQSPIVITDQFVSSETDQSFSLKFKQDSVQRLQPKSLLRSQTAEKVEIKPLLPTLRTERQVKSGSGLFDVLVRKEGKFVKVGSGYSDLATAFNRGRQEVKNTARASFKIVSRLGEPQKFNIGSDRSLTTSKRDANVVVQKREFRISSEGEKTEISRKGVFTQKLKRSGIFK